MCVDIAEISSDMEIHTTEIFVDMEIQERSLWTWWKYKNDIY
jgi:hypothetical protein